MLWTVCGLSSKIYLIFSLFLFRTHTRTNLTSTDHHQLKSFLYSGLALSRLSQSIRALNWDFSLSKTANIYSLSNLHTIIDFDQLVDGSSEGCANEWTSNDEFSHTRYELLNLHTAHNVTWYSSSSSSKLGKKATEFSNNHRNTTEWGGEVHVKTALDSLYSSAIEREWARVRK